MRKICIGNYLKTGEPVEASLRGLGNILIAGSSGTGKTILLETLVKQLADIYPKDEMRFVIYDETGWNYRFILDDDHRNVAELFKDAAKFTDALASLKREHDERNAGAPRLPRYVIIIDEFASLRNDADLMCCLEIMMRDGSKTGFHFFIATQCPGLYADEMRANSNSLVAFPMRNVDAVAFCGRPLSFYPLRASGDCLLLKPSGGKLKRKPIHIDG